MFGVFGKAFHPPVDMYSAAQNKWNSGCWRESTTVVGTKTTSANGHFGRELNELVLTGDTRAVAWGALEVGSYSGEGKT